MSEKPMTPIEELDLARAKAILAASDLGMDWENAPSGLRHSCLHSARSIRLSDEARGLRVVPVEATEEMLMAAMIDDDCVYPPGSDFDVATRNEFSTAWRVMLSASPFAPGDGT